MAQYPRSLSTTLDKIAREAVGKDWNLYASLLAHWKEIVGQEYAQSTAPIKISFPKGKKTDEKWAGRQSGGTLFIKLPQGLTMEFGFLTDTIRMRINGFFGYPAIERIAFETYYPKDHPLTIKEEEPLGEMEIKQLEENTKAIENDELRELLQQLGSSVIRKTKED